MRIRKHFGHAVFAVAAVFMTVPMLSGCSSTELEPQFFYTSLVRRASMMDEYPDGFFQFGLMAAKKGSGLLTAEQAKERVESIAVHAPDGTTYELDPAVEFDFSGEEAWQGYIPMGEEKHAAWIYADLNYSAADPPPAGEYELELTSASGEVSTQKGNFRYDGEETMEGFPTNVAYEQDSRTLSWDAPEGDGIRYRVFALAGDKSEDDWSQMVYASSPGQIPRSEHRIPDHVEFESGRQYYFIVEAWQLPFFHIQDLEEEKVSFTAE